MPRTAPRLPGGPLLLVAALVAPLPSCGDDPGSTEADGTPTYTRANVILVTLDTVRADRLSCYGYERETTPNLDAFAAEAVRFDRAFSQTSFTPPSHASIMTSRYPSSHGLLWWDRQLPTEPATVAATLKAAGYATAAFSPLGMCTHMGLGRGFDHVYEPGEFRTRVDDQTTYHVMPARELNKEVFRWLGAREADQPFFAWVHYYDAHRPYSVFAPDREFCRIKDGALGNQTSLDYQLSRETRAERKLGAPQAAYLKDRYDSGLLGLDREVGSLLDELRAHDLLDDSVVIFTADHGEAFDEFEDEWFTHDPFLYDVVTHVPLLIRFPDGRFAGASRDALVELIDVVPTVLDYLDVELPQGMQGRSLRPVLEESVPRGERFREFVFSERQGKDKGPGGQPIDPGFRRSIRNDRLRLIVEVADDGVRMYDRGAEPTEQTDRYQASDPTAQRARHSYDRFVSGIEALRPDLDLQKDLEDLPIETIRVMIQNGYISADGLPPHIRAKL